MPLGLGGAFNMPSHSLRGNPQLQRGNKNKTNSVISQTAAISSSFASEDNNTGIRNTHAQSLLRGCSYDIGSPKSQIG